MRPALALLLLLAAAPALAQDGAAPRDKESKKKKVIRLEAITIEGRVQKPQAFYILQRARLSFDTLHEPESFVPKVVQSVEKEPF